MPPYADLANQATKLNKDVTDLKTKAVGTAGDLASELDTARTLEADAAQVNRPHRERQPVRDKSQEPQDKKSVMSMSPLQAADGAAAAFNNAKKTRDAVGETLRNINSMLANLSEYSFTV